jgi:predicted DNA-binding protein
MYNDKMMILLPTEMKEEVKKIAKEQYKTVSNYVRDLIVKDMEERK